MPSLSTLLTGGVGGVTFFAVWAYLILRWVLSGGFTEGELFFF